MGTGLSSKNYLKALIPIIAGLILLAIPTPAGLSVNAWRYFALFVAVIVGVILEPIPAAAIGLIGVTIAAVFCLVDPSPSGSIKWALSGFSDTTIWLIFAGFMFAAAFKKTGLGKRIALHIVKAIGRRTIGVGYATTLANTILGPFLPTNTGRLGGIIYPIIANIPPVYGSEPWKPTAKRIGSYIMWSTFAADSGPCTLFLTGLAPNLLVVALTAEVAKINITWMDWLISGLIIGLVIILLVPYLAYKLYPPEIKESPEVVELAKNELEKMGKMTSKEKILLALMFFALILWVAGEKYIHSTSVAILVLSLMLVFKILDWKDFLLNESGWNVLIWFGTLVTLAGGLAKVGIVEWIVKNLKGSIATFSPLIALLLIVTAFFWTHYAFASMTAHVTALYPPFLALAMTIPGLSPKAAALILGHIVGVFGVISPYATGPAPIYYGSGYISSIDFWKLGFIFGLIYFILLVAIGIPWITALY